MTYSRIQKRSNGRNLYNIRYPLLFADCFVVTPARKMDAVIMTGDPEFKNVEHIIEIEWLAK